MQMLHAFIQCEINTRAKIHIGFKVIQVVRQSQ